MPRPSSKPKEQRRTGRLTPEQIALISPHQFRYSLPQAAHLVNLSVAELYVRAREGRVKLTKDGGRTFMTREEVQRVARGDEVAA